MRIVGRDKALARREDANARGEQVETPFFYTSSLLATYMHLYWGEEMGFLESWLNKNLTGSRQGDSRNRTFPALFPFNPGIIRTF